MPTALIKTYTYVEIVQSMVAVYAVKINEWTVNDQLVLEGDKSQKEWRKLGTVSKFS